MNQRVRMVFDGAVAGIIGAFVIALWYLIFDAARGQPLGSLGSLAATLFGGTQAGAALMLGRLVFHFCVFALIGVVAALILETAEHDETLFPTMMLLVPVFEIFCIMILMLIGPSAHVSLPWWKFLIGDLMATSAMLAFFLERHPTLARRMEGPWTGVAREGALAGVIGAVVVAVWFMACDIVAGEDLSHACAPGCGDLPGHLRPGPGAGDSAPGVGLHGAAFLRLHHVRDCDRGAVARG